MKTNCLEKEKLKLEKRVDGLSKQVQDLDQYPFSIEIWGV